MKKLLKKLVIKSYTRDYYHRRLDEIETQRMKASIKNEFTSFVRYACQYTWLHIYTSVIDFFINTVIVLCLFTIKFFILIIFFAVFMIINM